MTQQEILNSNLSKTAKMNLLFDLGLSRTDVARLMNCGYGFVQNVYARRFGTGRTNRRTFREIVEEAEYRLTNFTFNHTFGVEIEACGVRREELKTELRAAGIEVEDESYNHSTRNHWKIVSDGSLTGSYTFELVSPKLTGETGLRQLKTVCLILKGLETKINKSCGLHIHFDASNFTGQTWKNLFKNYAKLEREIDSFMPNSRRANQNGYCKSLRVSAFENKIDSVENLSEAERTLRELAGKLYTGSSDRYYKINAQSYWRHRSIEFRQHAGTVNEKKIQNWILFLARLIEYSKQATVRSENWNSLKNFLPDEILNYYENRKRELAAA